MADGGLAGLMGAYGSEEEEEERMEEEAGGQVTILGRSEEDEEMQGIDLSHLTAPAGLAELDTAATQPAAAPAHGPSQQAKTGGEEQLPDAPAAPGEGREAGAQPAADDAVAPPSILPPDILQPPEGECDPALQAKVATWINMQRMRGRYINQQLRHSRGYRNPEFFRKMVEHLEIDEYGSSFAPEVFDPHGLPKEDYIEELQKEWAAEEERRKAQRAQTGRIEFTKSASQPTLAHNPLLPGLNPSATSALAAAQFKAAQLAAGAVAGAAALPPTVGALGGTGAAAGAARGSKWDAPRR